MTHDINQLVQTAVAATGAAQTRAAARLMSLLENQPQRLAEMFQTRLAGGAESSAIQAIESVRSPALILGITGAPGAGKSTMTDSLIAEYRKRHPERRVGVVAVDPSSPFTGGAVLGDRVRMMRHATDPLVFVRSMATRGHLGGLTLGVRGVIRVLELIGCDLILIETVGVGQSEVEVARVADLTIVVLAPGQGDSVQMLKAGLMEIADLFVVNKADRPGAAELKAQLQTVLKLALPPEDCGPHHGMMVEGQSLTHEQEIESRLTPVYLVSAADQTGMDTLVDALEEWITRDHAKWNEHRRLAIHEEIRLAVLEEARARVESTLGSNGTVSGQVQRVLSGQVTVAQLAQELLHKTAQSSG